MNKHVSSNILASVGLLFATTTALAGTPPAKSVNPAPHPNVICATCGGGGGGGGGGGDSSSPGWQVAYFHKDRASRTYALKLKNGLSAKFDFTRGVATLSYANKQAQYSLNSVILKATNNNAQAASAMYNALYQSISAQHSDQIMHSTANGPAAANALTGPGSWVTSSWDNHDPLFDVPGTPGSCWPVATPCNTYTGGLGNWGTYNNWWTNPFGGSGGPSPSQPPNPDGCAPTDIDCKMWEHDRQNACGSINGDIGALLVVDAGTAFACASALASDGSLTLVCAGGLISVQETGNKLETDTQKCNTPYPY